MKVLFIFSLALTYIGGTQKVLSMVSEKLVEENNDVKFLILSPLSEIDKDKSEWVEPFKSNKNNVYPRYFEPSGFEFVIDGIKIARGIPIPTLYNTILEFLKLEFAPDIIITNQQLYIRSIREAVESLSLNSKIIAWHQNSLYLKWDSDFKHFIISRIINLLRPKQVIYADAHLAISTGIRDQILSINPQAKIYTVFNPLDPYSGALVQRSETPIFLFVGRLDDKQKNLKFMLNGLSKLQSCWKLKIIGTGQDKNKLKNFSNSLGLSSKLEWSGFVKGDPYRTLNEGVTALILTSRFEGFGMVLTEANQRGIPAISSDCQAGPADIIIPGKNGYLFPEGDMNDFVQILNDVIDGKLGFDIPENIAKTAERFSEEKVCGNILKALSEIEAS